MFPATRPAPNCGLADREGVDDDRGRRRRRRAQQGTECEPRIMRFIEVISFDRGPATCLLFIVATAGIRRMGGQVRQELVSAQDTSTTHR